MCVYLQKHRFDLGRPVILNKLNSRHLLHTGEKFVNSQKEHINAENPMTRAQVKKNMALIYDQVFLTTSYRETNLISFCTISIYKVLTFMHA
jgi:hypothetical protein